MSFVAPEDAFTVEETGTYTSEDGTVSTQLNAGDVISVQQAAELGLTTIPEKTYDDPSQMPDTAENAEAIHGTDPEAAPQRSKGAAPENRNRGAAPDQRKAEDGK